MENGPEIVLAVQTMLGSCVSPTLDGSSLSGER